MAAKVPIICPKCREQVYVTFPQVEKHRKKGAPIPCSCGFGVPAGDAIDQLAATALDALNDIINRDKPSF